MCGVAECVFYLWRIVVLTACVQTLSADALVCCVARKIERHNPTQSRTERTVRLSRCRADHNFQIELDNLDARRI